MDHRRSRRWWVLAALAVALLTIGLDVTVLNVALPTLATALDASTSDLQWIAGSYTLVLAVGVLPAGVLGDRFGPKRLLLLALSIFGLASGACALATSPGQLVAARAALGVGAALMIPLSMSLLTRLFHGAERTRAITIWTMAMAIGIPLGPIVGGLLLDHVGWPAIFLINLPLVAIGLVAIAVLVPAIPGSHTAPVDLVGLLLSSGGLGLLTYGVIEAGRHGWGDPLVTATTGVGVALLVGLALRLRFARYPLVERALLRSRAFTAGAVTATVGSFLLMAAMFLVPQFSHAVLGADAIGTGLQLLPAIGGLLVGARVAETLVHRLGATRVVAAGFLVAAVGLGVGGLADLGAGYGVSRGVDRVDRCRCRVHPAARRWTSRWAAFRRGPVPPDRLRCRQFGRPAERSGIALVGIVCSASVIGLGSTRPGCPQRRCSSGTAPRVGWRWLGRPVRRSSWTWCALLSCTECRTRSGRVRQPRSQRRCLRLAIPASPSGRCGRARRRRADDRTGILDG